MKRLFHILLIVLTLSGIVLDRADVLKKQFADTECAAEGKDKADEKPEKKAGDEKWLHADFLLPFLISHAAAFADHREAIPPAYSIEVPSPPPDPAS